jgi:GTP diphosphokinase / guanosine-3',5'-bis(diphosphate) 3'-diphosphatase
MEIMDEEEKLLIQHSYRQMLKTLKKPPTEIDKVNIRKAFEIAVEGHSKQRRKSGEAYILHPIEVARICVEEIGLGPTAVICALLHDTIEDTDVTFGEIKEKFGDRIALIVDGLTKLDATYEQDQQQAENFKKVLNTLTVDVRVVLIKLADRLHNMRTLGSMPRHKQLKIASETSYIYAPLAHRLGLNKIKTELQDLCLKITDPESFKEIANKLKITKRERDSYIDKFIAPLKSHLDASGYKYKVSGRPKSISSIHSKIKNKNIPFEDIYDLFAIRILLDIDTGVSEKAACWMIYSIVTDVYTPLPERLKDFIALPKSNGYQSLHSTVLGPEGRYVEVQIRSERMDEIAEMGFAAHYKYKEGNKFGDTYDKFLDNVRVTLEEQNEIESNQFVEDFKNSNLQTKEIYITTPKGELKSLPEGATALDFAFSLHSDIGYHCYSAKVNEKLVPMGTVLKSSDRVQIYTSPNQKPSEDWLKLVVTGKAKQKIRNAIKDERKKQGEIGKEMLMRKLNAIKANFDDLNIDFLIKYFESKNRIEFYYAITIGRIDLKILKKLKVEHGRIIIPKELKPAVTPTTSSSARKVSIGTHKNELIINNEPTNDIAYSFATCCNPVPGDDVFAYLTGNSQGFKIHRTNCPNATNLMANSGYRIMKAEWGTPNASSFSANIHIIGIDDGPGVIERLTNKISNHLGLNIRSLWIEANEGYYEGKLSIYVQNKAQLDLTIRTLKSLQSVSNVIRVE